MQGPTFIDNVRLLHQFNLARSFASRPADTHRGSVTPTNPTIFIADFYDKPFAFSGHVFLCAKSIKKSDVRGCENSINTRSMMEQCLIIPCTLNNLRPDDGRSFTVTLIVIHGIYRILRSLSATCKTKIIK